MLKRFFDRFRKPKENPKSTTSKRDLFQELFPLSEENKQHIESRVYSIFEGMHGQEGLDAMKNYSREYQVIPKKFRSLNFDSLGWESFDIEEDGVAFRNEYGDIMLVMTSQPNGKMVKGNSELLVYRNWLREQYVNQGGGLIFCEEIVNDQGVEAYESIAKLPRENTTGMDYTYFLNISNYEEQMLYQLNVRVLEMSPTGTRDNILLVPLCDISGMEMMEFTNHYRQDPYQAEYEEGNRMNLSEREEFDYLYPFHPLSILRNEIRPKLLKSLKFNS